MEFCKLDRANTRSRRPRWKVAAERILSLRMREVAETAVDDVLREPFANLDSHLADAFEKGDRAAGDIALDRFDTELSKAAQAYFERLRAGAGDGVEELRGSLANDRWSGVEIGGIRVSTQWRKAGAGFVALGRDQRRPPHQSIGDTRSSAAGNLDEYDQLAQSVHKRRRSHRT